jgi:hypothetical protein
MSRLTGVHAIYSIHKRGTYEANKLNDMSLIEFLYLALSCYTWRKNNGPIKLVCDDNFYEFVKKWNIEWMWDEIDLETLKRLPNDIDYQVYWTYPKMFVQFEQKERFAILDADLYTDYDYTNFTEDIIYGHEEIDSTKFAYPDINRDEAFKEIFKDFHENLYHNAINTCFVIYNNLDILNQLREVSDKFVRVDNNYISDDRKPWRQTIYCEQKVLGNIVKNNGFSYRNLLEPHVTDAQWADSLPKLFGEMESKYKMDHIWIRKYEIRDYTKKNEMTLATIKKIKYNYPELYDKLKSMKLMNR